MDGHNEFTTELYGGSFYIKPAGGDVKSDYVIVPTAQVVVEEACFDSTKQPFPLSYAQQRRMAQRFDQSLIMEGQVVATNP